MMGKRYYCDYCERCFIDDIESRKKHLKSVNHESLKKLHYLQYRDLKTLIQEERLKVECKRFKKGECPFGDNCNYTHYSDVELQHFEDIVRQHEKQKNNPPILKMLDDWLKKEEENKTLSKQSYFTPKVPLYYDVNMLPPSLRPPTLEQIEATTFEDWG